MSIPKEHYGKKQEKTVENFKMTVQERLKKVLDELKCLEDALEVERGLDNLTEIEKSYKSLHSVVSRSYANAVDMTYKRNKIFKERYSR